jgi:uncharacterized protein YgbK (DUF1537 family)
VRAGVPAIETAIEKARAAGIRIAIADTETDDDLNALVAIDAKRDDLLWVGSAGLIEALPLPRPRAHPSRSVHRRRRGRLCFSSEASAR